MERRRKAIINVVDITTLDATYQRKDVAVVEKKAIEERCTNHETRICGMERKINATLVAVVCILGGVIVELALTIIRSGVH